MMNAKLALAAVLAALLSGCADAPTWNTSVFPQEPTYGATSDPAPVAVAPTK
jgi:hypothetical protein